MELNEKLQQLRKDKGLTQEELANKLYVSRTAISKWESGRGYPSIESLKAISKLFSLSIDELLSGEELIMVAEADHHEKVKSLCDLVFGVSDCLSVLLLFLPFFGQRDNDMVRAVSLLSLNTDKLLYTLFLTITVLTFSFGMIELSLQNLQHKAWLKSKRAISFFLTVLGTMIFIISPQPYAAAFLLCLLIMKGVLIIKR